MGKYLNFDSNGKSLGSGYKEKIDNLKKDGAIEVKPEFQRGLVCVVNNGTFGAAAYCYSEEEFKDFVRPDGRAKTWLQYQNAATLAQ